MFPGVLYILESLLLRKKSIHHTVLFKVQIVQISSIELLLVVHASVHDKIFERERGQRVERRKKESDMFVIIIFHKRCL